MSDDYTKEARAMFDLVSETADPMESIMTAGLLMCQQRAREYRALPEAEAKAKLAADKQRAEEYAAKYPGFRGAAYQEFARRVSDYYLDPKFN